MIEFLSSWAKSLGLAIVIVSILEMLLPNNKTKKYIRMVMGVYVLFCIISPFIKNKDTLDVSNFDLNEYSNYETQNSNDNTLNQTSMDRRIQELYIDELQKDITKKVEQQGYTVTTCKVEANISSEGEGEISKIKIEIEKNESNKETEEEGNTIENRIVEEIQKIKPINTNIETEESGNSKDENNENGNSENSGSQKVTNVDIQNIKKFLMEEYGVSEKCLEIN